ncbi:MAG: hypothetical protein NC180_07220 [Muribaculaceae bacterium]|nr:hypothetical protein [Roseburia sp.]MCM1429979.1 hypothetical protein [Muribaculaceae bacterium]MCM1492994.1 hypothetical protein [Muribaculaceae bacterium]
MKNAIKKLLVCVTVCGMVLAGSDTQLLADSDFFNGSPVGYSVTIDSVSATAVTSFSKPAEEISVQATVYYKREGTTYQRISGWKTATIGGISATAAAKGRKAITIGGKGEHRIISRQGTTWSGTSYVGTVEETAIFE